MYPLEIDHVTKRYGHEVVVDDLSFTVAPGRVTGFLGPNGAGKSTTMKVLLDLASATTGHATIAGTRYRDLTDPARPSGSSSSRTRSTRDAAAATTCASSTAGSWWCVVCRPGAVKMVRLGHVPALLHGWTMKGRRDGRKGEPHGGDG